MSNEFQTVEVKQAALEQQEKRIAELRLDNNRLAVLMQHARTASELDRAVIEMLGSQLAEANGENACLRAQLTLLTAAV